MDLSNKRYMVSQNISHKHVLLKEYFEYDCIRAINTLLYLSISKYYFKESEFEFRRI